MRATQKGLQNRFEMLCEALGMHTLEQSKEKDAWHLEYIQEYGGWKITTRGGVDPFGTDRHTTEEMDNLISFALRAIQLDRQPKSHMYWPSKKEAA